MPEQSKILLVCPTCGRSNIRPSASRGFVDGALALFGLAAFRCRNCRRRFHRFSRRSWNEFRAVDSTPMHSVRLLSVLDESQPVPQVIDLTPEQPPQTKVAVEEEPLDAGAMIEETRSILIVDSDLSIRRLLRRVLEREGYRIHELGHAENLLWELRETPVDLLITDLDMPQQEGLETIRALKREYPDLKIIVLSGFWAADSFRMRGVPGTFAVLAKPFRTEALLDGVRTALTRTETPRVVR